MRLAWRGGRTCEAAAAPNNSNHNINKKNPQLHSAQLNSCGDTVRPLRARPSGPYRHCKTTTCMCEASYTTGRGSGDRWLDRGKRRRHQPVEGDMRVVFFRFSHNLYKHLLYSLSRLLIAHDM